MKRKRLSEDDFVEEIKEKSKGKIDDKELRTRLKKIENIRLKKIDRETELKYGRKFIEENKNRILIKKYDFGEFAFAIGVLVNDPQSIYKNDGKGRSFSSAVCFCSPNDFKKGKWSNRIARSIIGNRLNICSNLRDISYPVRVEISFALKSVYYEVLSEASCAGDGVPIWLFRDILKDESVFALGKSLNTVICDGQKRGRRG